MVLPTIPANSLKVSQIYTEYSIAANSQKRISNDLFPLVNGTAGTICQLGASFSGKSAVVETPLYSFTSITFTNAGATGRSGPSTAQCTSTYSGTNAWVTNTSYFNTSSGIQLWTVPSTKTYTFVVAGAGGSYNFTTLPTTTTYGAVGTVSLSLAKSDVIRILVGQSGTYEGAGSDKSSGGCGGTYIFNQTKNTLLAIAGGAGGSGADGSTSGKGSSGSTTTTPTAPYNGTGSAGTGGGGGGADTVFSSGSGGGGYSGNGASSTAAGATGGGGLSYTNGGTGGKAGTQVPEGGFGGGGGTYIDWGTGAPGGGGGYNGGGAGNYAGRGQGAGGGGSYVSTSWASITQTNGGMGYVSIS